MKASTHATLIRTTISSVFVAGLLAATFASQASSYKMVKLTADEQHQTDAPTASELKFDDAMNRCVQLTATATLMAPAACNQAVIQSRYASRGQGESGRKLKAYAYSNRGVSKLKAQDQAGALSDFQTAVNLKADAITEHNLQLLVRQLNSVSRSAE